MRKFVLPLSIVILVLALVMAVRTMRFVPYPDTARGGEPLPVVNDSLLAAHLAGAVRIPTVSYQDSTPQVAQLRALHGYLEQTFPRTYAALSHEVVGDASLLFRWAGSDTTLQPVVMMAHLDVVPVEPGTDSAWTHRPFSGDVAEGFVWGRGTLDDKVGVLSTLEGVEALLARKYRPRRTVYLAFGDDEEVAGHGAADIVELLRARGVRPLVAVDEGSAVVEGIVPGIDRPVGLIGIAEKGHMSVQLTVSAEGGHSSMPPPQTAVGVLAQAIDRLEKHPLPPRLDGPTAAMFDHLGREMPLGTRIAMANLWLTRSRVIRSLAASPTTNASIRTTTAPTVIRGSPKANVLPTHAQAIVNFRIISGETPATVLSHVRSVVDDPRVSITLSGQPAPPSPVSSTTSAAYRTLERGIRALAPSAIISPSLVVGATDARVYGGFARDVYRFLPVRVGPNDLDRFHGTNERIGVRDYGRAVGFMTNLIAALSTQ